MIRTANRTRRAASAPEPIAVPAADARASATAGYVTALLCALGLLAGCGNHLKPDVPEGVSLAGPWKLNRQASEDPDALITAIVEKEMKHLRRHTRFDEGRSEGPPPSGQAGPGGPGRHRVERVDPPNGMFRPREGMESYLRSQYTNALGSILNGEGLVIEQAPDRFTIIRDGSHRSFTPGGHSVIGVTNGVADQTSGWKGREYVIDVQPQVGPRVTERFGLGPDGQLIEKVSLSGDELRKLEFTRVYDRGTPPTHALPGS